LANVVTGGDAALQHARPSLRGSVTVAHECVVVMCSAVSSTSLSSQSHRSSHHRRHYVTSPSLSASPPAPAHAPAVAPTASSPSVAPSSSCSAGGSSRTTAGVSVSGDAVARCAGSTSPPDPHRRSHSRGSSCSGSHRCCAVVAQP